MDAKTRNSFQPPPPPRQKGKQPRKRKDHSEMDASKHSSVCSHTWLKEYIHWMEGRYSSKVRIKMTTSGYIQLAKT